MSIRHIEVVGIDSPAERHNQGIRDLEHVAEDLDVLQKSFAGIGNRELSKRLLRHVQDIQLSIVWMAKSWDEQFGKEGT